MIKERSSVVITGGASGIGKALAFRFGKEGHDIIIGDVEEAALEIAISELRSEEILATGIVVDVSDLDSVRSFRDQIFSEFSPPYILCLNAGVGAGGSISESSVLDWEWVLGVNLWGVIYGLNTFLPFMEDNNNGHIIITSSIAGHLSYPNMGVYNASKHAVLSIAETLCYELQEKGIEVGVSVLCPGLVKTNILDSERNRPEILTSNVSLNEPDDQDTRKEAVREIYNLALDPDSVADLVFKAVESKQFYIFTENTFQDAIKTRHRDIELVRNPMLGANLVEEHLNDTD
ncbi:MAG: SDR family NAD(P)-dependent oxidoreductase [Acidimicrobiales bacterium]|jgi:NAD(P)-dependent dehydrogenase (short-subunit alcohol dehydrogenase family)|nr:SDR family NAD(P)-dependent oxidoreductase [Acidimicrobiales bacterium]|tara:strand:+ start:59 stop:928 length:870 start_codon:yes stop_codon:yes gene_type:complete